jgi:hypothetical protein
VLWFDYHNPDKQNNGETKHYHNPDKQNNGETTHYQNPDKQDMIKTQINRTLSKSGSTKHYKTQDKQNNDSDNVLFHRCAVYPCFDNVLFHHCCFFNPIVKWFCFTIFVFVIRVVTMF